MMTRLLHLESRFPNLSLEGYEPSSLPAVEYNCLAYAAGDVSKIWDGYPMHDAYWPQGAIHGHDVAALVSAYSLLDYRACQMDGSLESGYEKIAIYGSSDLTTYYHAAKQRRDGRWESKIGELEDIVHYTTRALEGVAYGTVVLYMKRPIRTSRSFSVEEVSEMHANDRAAARNIVVLLLLIFAAGILIYGYVALEVAAGLWR